jgi:AcrR family transcriptional regulator
MNLHPEKKHPSLTKEHILQTAGRLVSSEGVSALTLDAVAKAAGVSKGGLLYHFPSKEALMLAMIDSRHEWIKGVHKEERERLADPTGPGSWHRALINVGFQHCHGCDDVTADMLAVVAQEPSYQKRLLEGLSDWIALRLQDGVDRAVSNLIHASLDGIKFHKIVGLPTPPVEELEELKAFLHRLVDESISRNQHSITQRESA